MGGDPFTVNYCSTALPKPASLPPQLVKLATWEQWLDLPVEDMRMIDWGFAFPTTSTAALGDVGQPQNLISPETFFIGTLDAKHDLWRAGSVVCRTSSLPLNFIISMTARSMPCSTKRTHFLAAGGTPTTTYLGWPMSWDRFPMFGMPSGRR